jgi:hypothetical protein
MPYLPGILADGGAEPDSPTVDVLRGAAWASIVFRRNGSSLPEKAR